jgi:transposase
MPRPPPSTRRRPRSRSTRVTWSPWATERWTRSAVTTRPTCARPATGRPPAASKARDRRCSKHHRPSAATRPPRSAAQALGRRSLRLRASGSTPRDLCPVADSLRRHDPDRPVHQQGDPHCLTLLVGLAQTIRRHRDGILAAIHRGISRRRTEALNNKLSLITRRGYGSTPPRPALARHAHRAGHAQPATRAVIPVSPRSMPRNPRLRGLWRRRFPA